MPSVLLPDPTLAIGAVGSVMLWLGVLLVAVLVGGFALLILRRQILDSGAEDGGFGFDLRALRAMRDRGEISEEEFETARAGIIGALSGDRSSTTPTPVRTPRAPWPVSPAERRAEPGFDLTGEPLPDFDERSDDGATDEKEQGPEN